MNKSRCENNLFFSRFRKASPLVLGDEVLVVIDQCIDLEHVGNPGVGLDSILSEVILDEFDVVTHVFEVALLDELTSSHGRLRLVLRAVDSSLASATNFI